MTLFKLRTGVFVIDDGSSRFILDETGQKRVTSHPASELTGLIRQGLDNEDALVAAMEERFSLKEIYFALIQLEKQGIIVDGEAPPESPAELFRAKADGRAEMEYPRHPVSPLAIRISAIGEADLSADALAASLARSELLKVALLSGELPTEPDRDAVYVVVTPDYLEPQVETFGRLAHEHGLRWLPFKPCGVIPWMGPLFVPGETGCVSCLLDRVTRHRRLETDQIRENGGERSLRLSTGQTAHSLETATGLLGVELEKLAVKGSSEMVGGALSLDFRTLRLERHPLARRPQCPVCGTLSKKVSRAGVIPGGSLSLQSRQKADYHDGGERICSAMETLEKYARLISPITGVVGELTPLEDIPPCFGPVIRSSWIVRGNGDKKGVQQNPRLSPLGFSSGKGRSVPQARVSALAEAIERYSTQHEGYEPHIRASFIELGDAVIHPHDLMGFSEKQYRNREAWCQKGEASYVPYPYDPARPIDWTPAWSITQQRRRLVPSAFVYYSYPREGGGDICLGCSNGVAAGNCFEEAVMQGFFELVEREAVAMWWYHKLLKPAVDWHSFDSPFVAAVDAAMDRIGMRLDVLDLTHDLGIPVFAANLFIQNEGYRFKAMGLGCHRDPQIALERAVSELGQSWKSPGMDRHNLKLQKRLESTELFLRSDPRQTPKGSSDFRVERNSDFLDDIHDVVQLLCAKGLEMIVIDLTRPDVGFPVARVAVPGMAHFWPRFGCRRLIEIPKEAGWIDKDVDEDDLNPVPFCL